MEAVVSSGTSRNVSKRELAHLRGAPFCSSAFPPSSGWHGGRGGWNSKEPRGILKGGRQVIGWFNGRIGTWVCEDTMESPRGFALPSSKPLSYEREIYLSILFNPLSYFLIYSFCFLCVICNWIESELIQLYCFYCIWDKEPFNYGLGTSVVGNWLTLEGAYLSWDSY